MGKVGKLFAAYEKRIAQLEAEKADLTEALRTLSSQARPVFTLYEKGYEEHEMVPGSPNPDSLFVALNGAVAALAKHQQS